MPTSQEEHLRFVSESRTHETPRFFLTARGLPSAGRFLFGRLSKFHLLRRRSAQRYQDLIDAEPHSAF